MRSFKICYAYSYSRELHPIFPPPDPLMYGENPSFLKEKVPFTFFLNFRQENGKFDKTKKVGVIQTERSKLLLEPTH